MTLRLFNSGMKPDGRKDFARTLMKKAEVKLVNSGLDIQYIINAVRIKFIDHAILVWHWDHLQKTHMTTWNTLSKDQKILCKLVCVCIKYTWPDRSHSSEELELMEAQIEYLIYLHSRLPATLKAIESKENSKRAKNPRSKEKMTAKDLYKSRSWNSCAEFRCELESSGISTTLSQVSKWYTDFRKT